jgi:hypothetical protein
LIISQEFIWKRKNLKNEKPKRITKVTSLFGQNGIWERQKVDDQIPQSLLSTIRFYATSGQPGKP